MQYVLNTQMANFTAMHHQIEMFAKKIDQEMEIVCKVVV
jgi:hypothetical protein